MMTGVDDLGLDPHRAVRSGSQVEFRDVESEFVEPLDAAGNAPALCARHSFGRREFGPEALISPWHLVGDRNRVEIGRQSAAGLQVHEAARDVEVCDLDVVPSLTVREYFVQFAGLGVDQIRREGPRVAPEQHIRQRAVVPHEPDQVHAGQKQHQCVQQSVHGLWTDLP